MKFCFVQLAVFALASSADNAVPASRMRIAGFKQDSPVGPVIAWRELRRDPTKQVKVTETSSNDFNQGFLSYKRNKKGLPDPIVPPWGPFGTFGNNPPYAPVPYYGTGYNPYPGFPGPTGPVVAPGTPVVVPAPPVVTPVPAGSLLPNPGGGMAAPGPNLIAPINPGPNWIAPTNPGPNWIAPTNPGPNWIAPTTPGPNLIAPTTPGTNWIAPSIPWGGAPNPYTNIGTVPWTPPAGSGPTIITTPAQTVLPDIVPVTPIYTYSDESLMPAIADPNGLDSSLMWLRYFLLSNHQSGNNTEMSNAPISIPINSSPTATSSSSSNTFVTISPKPMFTNYPASQGTQFFTGGMDGQGGASPSFTVSGDSGAPRISTDGTQTTISFVPVKGGEDSAPTAADTVNQAHDEHIENKMMDIYY